MRSSAAPRTTFTRLVAPLLASVVLAGAPSADAQSRVVAFTHVTLIDGTGGTPRHDVTVVIDRDRIAAIGGASDIRVPRNATTVDGRGWFLIPGLWDMHVHLGGHDHAAQVLPRLVGYGIAGVRDMASPIDDILRLRRDSANHTLLAPAIVAAGPILQRSLPFTPPPLVRVVANGGARQVVDELHDRGVDFIKVGDTLSRDAYFEIAAESKRVGLPFAGHLPVSVTAAEAALAGQRTIEHFGSTIFRGVLLACSTDEAQLGAVAQEALANALSGGPSPETTLFRAEFLNRLVDTFDRHKATALFESFVRNQTWHEPTLVALRDAWDTRRAQLSAGDAAAGDRVWTKTLEMFADMRKAGVRVLVGSDTPFQSGVPPLHAELVALVNAGMTASEVLQAATRGAAELLGRLETDGTIAVGKHANVVLLDADPLADIANARRVVAIVLAGRLITGAELQTIR